MESLGSAGDDGDGVDLTLSLSVGGNTAMADKESSADGPAYRRRKRKQAASLHADVMFGGVDVASAEDMAALRSKMLRTSRREETRMEGAAASAASAFSGDLWKSGCGVDGDSDKTRPRAAPLPNPSSRANPFGRSPLPVMYPYHQARYVAMPSGYGVACMMPCWGSAIPVVADRLRRSEGNVYEQAAGSVTSTCPSTACSNASKGMESIEVDNSGSNSSEISSHRSEPILGRSSTSSSSSDSKSNSNSRARKPGGEMKKPEAVPLSEGTKEFVPNAAQSRSPISKPPDSLEKISSALLRLPRVSTTGDGPNGRTINGFLHTCGKSEVRIVCVCHGSSFTPAEFVKHAGGTNISQALRQIVMVRC